MDAIVFGFFSQSGFLPGKWNPEETLVGFCSSWGGHSTAGPGRGCAGGPGPVAGLGRPWAGLALAKIWAKFLANILAGIVAKKMKFVLRSYERIFLDFFHNLIFYQGKLSPGKTLPDFGSSGGGHAAARPGGGCAGGATTGARALAMAKI